MTDHPGLRMCCLPLSLAYMIYPCCIVEDGAEDQSNITRINQGSTSANGNAQGQGRGKPPNTRLHVLGSQKRPEQAIVVNSTIAIEFVHELFNVLATN